MTLHTFFFSIANSFHVFKYESSPEFNSLIGISLCNKLNHRLRPLQHILRFSAANQILLNFLHRGPQILWGPRNWLHFFKILHRGTSSLLKLSYCLVFHLTHWWGGVPCLVLNGPAAVGSRSKAAKLPQLCQPTPTSYQIYCFPSYFTWTGKFIWHICCICQGLLIYQSISGLQCQYKYICP